MGSVVRTFRGVSANDRRAQRRSSLMEAGFAEVADVGVSNLTMSAVCARAGLTQRYFYESFLSRDDLLAALFDVISDELMERAVAALAAQPLDLYARGTAVLSAFFESVTDDPQRARLFTEAAGISAVAERKRAAVHRYAEFAVQQVCEVYGDVGAANRARLTLIGLVTVDGLADASITRMDSGIGLSRDEYVDVIVQMFVDAVAGVLMHANIEHSVARAAH